MMMMRITLVQVNWRLIWYPIIPIEPPSWCAVEKSIGNVWWSTRTCSPSWISWSPTLCLCIRCYIAFNMGYKCCFPLCLRSKRCYCLIWYPNLPRNLGLMLTPSLLVRSPNSITLAGGFTRNSSYLRSCSSFLLRCNSLGSWIRRNGRSTRTLLHSLSNLHTNMTGLQTILPRNSSTPISLANNATPHKFCTCSPVSRLHRDVLCWFPCNSLRMGTHLVQWIPLRPHFYCLHLNRLQLDCKRVFNRYRKYSWEIG